MSQLSHSSTSIDKYYTVIQFWNRLGLQARKNKESKHLEHFLSFPGQEAIGRVFTVDNWLAVQFHEPVQDISPRLKGSSIQPEVIEPLRIEHFLSGLLAEFLDIPAVFPVKHGFVIFAGNLEAGKGGQN